MTFRDKQETVCRMRGSCPASSGRSRSPRTRCPDRARPRRSPQARRGRGENPPAASPPRCEPTDREASPGPPKARGDRHDPIRRAVPGKAHHNAACLDRHRPLRRRILDHNRDERRRGARRHRRERPLPRPTPPPAEALGADAVAGRNRNNRRTRLMALRDNPSLLGARPTPLSDAAPRGPGLRRPSPVNRTTAAARRQTKIRHPDPSSKPRCQAGKSDRKEDPAKIWAALTAYFVFKGLILVAGPATTETDIWSRFRSELSQPIDLTHGILPPPRRKRQWQLAKSCRT